MSKRTTTAVWHEKYRRWQINVQKDGKRRSFYCGTPGRKGLSECHAKADAWLDEGIADNNIRVEKLFETWIEELKITTSRGHWELYEFFGRAYISPVIGNIRLQNLNEQHIQNVINTSYKNKKGKKPLSKKSLTNIRACLSAFVKYARKNKMTTLLVENVTIPRGATVKDKSILQPDSLSKLFTCDKLSLFGEERIDFYIYLYRFMVLTGLRPGEAIGLRWSDVANDHITIRRSINRYQEETAGKNANAKRVVYLIPAAIELLAQQKALLQSKGLLNAIVFPNTYGEVIHQISLNERWKKYCVYNSIPPTSLYELRHTFVSIAKCLPEGLLKQLVGHSKNMDTYGVYSHEVNGDLQNAAQIIAGAFDAILKAK